MKNQKENPATARIKYVSFSARVLDAVKWLALRTGPLSKTVWVIKSSPKGTFDVFVRCDYPMRLAIGTRPRGSNRVSLNFGANFSSGRATRATGVCEETTISTNRKVTHKHCPLNAADSVML